MLTLTQHFMKSLITVLITVAYIVICLFYLLYWNICIYIYIYILCDIYVAQLLNYGVFVQFMYFPLLCVVHTEFDV